MLEEKMSKYRIFLLKNFLQRILDHVCLEYCINIPMIGMFSKQYMKNGDLAGTFYCNAGTFHCNVIKENS